jgi:hypothetical protein
LKAYQEIKENNPQVTDKAERYRQKAEDISNQARAALAALDREPTNTSVTPAHAATNTNAPPVKDEGTAASPKGEAAEGGDKAAAEADAKTEAKPETEGENETANANKGRPRRAEPPTTDPVKPDPSESKAKNSNSTRGNKPPIQDKVNKNEGGSGGGPPL